MMLVSYLRITAITIKFTGRASKMSWTALLVEPACIGKTDGGRGVGPARWIGWTDKITYKHIRKYEY